jgi:hypothetical protein
VSFNRFLISELSLSRFYNAFKRRIVDIPDAFAWHMNISRSRVTRENLYSFQGRHLGQRCFIMANGPSLANMDLSPLANETTFGLNRLYLLFEKLSFQPTYYVCVNELVLEQFSSEIGALRMHKFLNWNRRRLFNADNALIDFVRLSLRLQDKFARNFQHPLYSGGTVTYVALQIAYIMGFSEVVLIGLDHSFADTGIPNKVEMRQSETDVNHFHPNYFPKGSKWQLPDLKRSELAYALARQAFERDGRQILDATVNGKCPVFKRADFDSLF